MADHPTLRAHGGYRKLRSFRAAQAVYDGTVAFCDRFVDKRSRTRDQMVQAARSGRQNIAEGSRASGTSSQTELRLVGVARASLDELLLDYEDFLRQRKLRAWAKDDPRAIRVRAIGMAAASGDAASGLDPYDPYRAFVEAGDAETAANTLICLIHQTNYLLDRQIRALEQQFINEGGYSERLAAARREARQRQAPWGRGGDRPGAGDPGDALGGPDRSDQPDQSDRSDPADPPAPAADVPRCPLCGQPMALRRARTGTGAGRPFWGCAAYPTCRGTRLGPPGAGVRDAP
ncbi:MAG: four helix bundle protein [Armatimonadetes bacterium]|nr:four helix bundle protein [Armatimonadota bacterium]